MVSQVPPFAWFSARDKQVGTIFALNEARARERQMSGDKPSFVGSKPIEEAQTGRYSAVGFMIDWNFPRRIREGDQYMRKCVPGNH